MTVALDRRQLGASDLHVSAVGLGGNTFGPPRLDEAQTARVIDAAIDLGVNFVDTALVYSGGASEEFLGACLEGRRDAMLIATKCHFFGAEDSTDVSVWLRDQLETSLRRLRTDHIDLYQLHFPTDLPTEAIIETLDTAVRTGKVRAIGVCNFASWRLAEWVLTAQAGGWAFPVTVQNYHNVLSRSADAEVVPACKRFGTSLLPYHPLAGGFLTGKYRRDEPPPVGSRGEAGSGIIRTVATETNWQRLAELDRYAAEHGHTLGELAIAWLLHNEVVGSVIAGVSNPEQLEANVRGATWHLAKSEIDEINDIVAGDERFLSPEVPPSLG